jgi:hypothetical protein
VFSVKLNIYMGTFDLNFRATVNEGGIAGQVDVGGFGTFPFSGTRA